MSYSNLKARKRAGRILLPGIILLLVGIGNFYVGLVKVPEHQNIVREMKVALSDYTNTEDTNALKFEATLKKAVKRGNYYGLVKIGGLVMILVSLVLVFIGMVKYSIV